MPTCPICDKTFKYINNTHLKSHGLTPTQFKEQYPEVDAIPQEIRDANKKNSILGMLKSQKVQRLQYDNRIEKYNTNPNKCENCYAPLTYEHRKNIFCSHSCAAKLRNLSREVFYSEQGKSSLRENGFKNQKNLNNRKVGLKQYENICTNCNNIFTTNTISKNKKTCSEECLNNRRIIINSKRNNKTFGKCGYYQGIFCASSWELAFLIYNIDLGKKIKRCELIFNYIINEVERAYFPDFQIDGHIIYEVKGREENDVALKTKAVINAGYQIEIIRRKEITPIIKFLKGKYGVKDVTELYDKKV